MHFHSVRAYIPTDTKGKSLIANDTQYTFILNMDLMLPT